MNEGAAKTRRALLFGLEAVRSGAADAAVVSEALTRCEGRIAVAFRDMLVERAQLSAVQASAIDARVDSLIDDGPLAELSESEARAGLESLLGPAVDAALAGGSDTPNRYSVLHEHASGGMGRILIVHDARIGRDVAMKELLPGPADADAATWSRVPSPSADPAAARFLHEARITGQLEHPAIVPVYEVGHRADGSVYYTMKYVRGKTLSEAIREADGLEGRLRLLPHFVDVCNAIAYAHSRGVIHRDLKPINIMVGEFGETVLLDWGLAKKIGEEAQEGVAPSGPDVEGLADFRTLVGQIVGTPAYMAPEQASGAIQAVDERSDVYGLGAVLYELLTGRPPFSGMTKTTTLRAVRRDGPPPVRSREPHAPPELAAVCERAMARRPADRYGAAVALRDEVARFQSGALVQTYRYSAPELAWRFVRRHRTFSIAAALSLCAIGAIAAGAYSRVSAERDLAQERLRESERLRVVAAEEEARALDALARQEREKYYHTVLLAEARLKDGDAGAVEALLNETPADLRHAEWGTLMRRARSEEGRAMTEPNGLMSAALSADGATLATGGRGGGISLWDAPTFALRHRIDDHREFTALAPMPDGAFLAVSNDGAAFRLDTERLVIEEIAARSADDAPASGIQALVHPNGRWAYIVDARWTLRRIDLSARTEAARRPVGGPNAQIALDAAGGRLMLTSWETPVRMLDAESLETAWQSETRSHVYAAALTVDDSRFLFGAFTSLNISAIEPDRLGPAISLGGLHAQETVCVVPAPDGRHVLTGGLDGRINVIDLDKAVVVGGAVSGDPIGGTGERYGGLFVDPAGEYVYAASRSGAVRRWRMETLFNRTRSTAAALGNSVPVTEARFEHGGRIGLAHAPRFSRGSTYGFGLAFAEDGGLLAATGTPRGTVGLIDGQTFDHRAEIVLDGDTADLNPTERFVAFRPGSGELVVGSKSGLYLIDVTGGEERSRRTIAIDGTIYDGEVGRDGRFASLGLIDSTHVAAVVDLEDGAVRYVELPGGLSATVGVTALAPAGDTLYIGLLQSPKLIRVDLLSGARTTLSMPGSGVYSLLAHPAEPMVIAGGADGVIRLLDESTGEETRRFTGHTGHVTCLELSGDGRRLLSSGHDMTARLWDWETGQLLQTLENRSWFALDARFHPQGTAIAVTDADHAVLVYPLAQPDEAGR